MVKNYLFDLKILVIFIYYYNIEYIWHIPHRTFGFNLMYILKDCCVSTKKTSCYSDGIILETMNQDLYISNTKHYYHIMIHSNKRAAS